MNLVKKQFRIQLGTGEVVYILAMAGYDGTICSCVGVVFLLIALASSQSGRMKGDTLTSLLLNMVGGIMATVGAILDSVWAFAVLNGVWALLSAVNIIRMHILAKREISHNNVENQPDVKPKEHTDAGPSL